MKIEIEIKTGGDETIEEEAFPDTGSSATCIGEEKLIELGMENQNQNVHCFPGGDEDTGHGNNTNERQE